VYELSDDGIVVPKCFGVIKGYIGVYIVSAWSWCGETKEVDKNARRKQF
jgi:hypothetical protein